MKSIFPLQPARKCWPNCAAVLLAALLLSPLFGNAEPIEKLQLAQFQGAGDAGQAYLQQMLREALAQTSDYRQLPVGLSELAMSPQRMFSEITRPQGLANIALWACEGGFMNEPGVRRIDVPVDRGIASYWLLLTREELLPRFRQIKSLEKLRQMKLTFGFPLGKNLRPAWREYLDIYDAPDVTQAMRMLQHGRFDAILLNPSFIPKIRDSLPADGPSLAFEPTLLLEYPSATCFAVGEQNEALARQLQQGLQAVIRSGGAKRISEATGQKNMSPELDLDLSRRQRLQLPASDTMARILKPYSEWLYKP